MLGCEENFFNACFNPVGQSQPSETTLREVSMLTLLPGCPMPASDPSSDYLWLYSGCQGDQVSLLVYEQHRDFLSAPRSYVILPLQVAAVELDAGNDYEDATYDEGGQMVESGIFMVRGSELAGDRQQHLLFSLAAEQIEAIADWVGVPSVICAVDAQSALLMYFER